MVLLSIQRALACSSRYISTSFLTLVLPYRTSRSACSFSVPLTYLSMIVLAWLKTHRDLVPWYWREANRQIMCLPHIVLGLTHGAPAVDAEAVATR